MKYKRRIILLAVIIPLIISSIAIWNIKQVVEEPSENSQKITYNYLYKEVDEIPGYGSQRAHEVANKLTYISKVRVNDIDKRIIIAFACVILTNIVSIVTIIYIIVNEHMRTRENNDGNVNYFIDRDMESQQKLDGFMKYQDEKEKVKLGIENKKNT